MSKAVAVILSTAVACALGICLYFLGVTLRLENRLNNLTMPGQEKNALAAQIAREREIAALRLQKKYADEIGAFAKLARELQNEKNKAEKLAEYHAP